MGKLDIKHITHIVDDEYLVMPKWQKLAWLVNFNAVTRKA